MRAPRSRVARRHSLYDEYNNDKYGGVMCVRAPYLTLRGALQDKDLLEPADYRLF